MRNRQEALADRLDISAIKQKWNKNPFCKNIIYFPEIDSTNQYAGELAKKGEPEGTVVVADTQKAGRGRRGRTWDSCAGAGIYMSCILRPALQPMQISSLTLIAALAMCEAIREVCQVTPQIKWPNDIVLHGKKLCGILTELCGDIQQVEYVVVGVGVNVNQSQFSQSLADKATSLYLETGNKIERNALIAAFVQTFATYYMQYVQEGNLRSFVDLYHKLLANKDQPVKVFHGMIEDAVDEDVTFGVARGIDETGALLVETEGTIRKVIAGEVSIRGVNGYV